MLKRLRLRRKAERRSRTVQEHPATGERGEAGF